MFSLYFLLLLCVSVRAELISRGTRRCRDITDIEELCSHKKQCLDVMPDLPNLCRSFTKAKYGVEEFVEIIDARRSDIYIIEQLAGAVPYSDASAPIIIQGPKNLTVTPGSEYQLECKAEGAPTPKLTITRKSEASLKRVAASDKGLEVQLSAAQVIHKNERVQISDEGWYRCVAANSRGVVYSDAYLRVYDLCKDIKCEGGRVCIPDNYAGTAECLCPECLTYEYNPLCGTDCITHFNPCLLDHKNCLEETSYTMFLDTAYCPDFTPPEFDILPDPVLDVVEDKTVTLTCTANPAGDSPGPPPIIAWYRAGENPTGELTEWPTVAGDIDYDEKLGEGETLKVRVPEGEFEIVYCVAHQCKHGQSIPIDIVSHPIKLIAGPGQLNYWPYPSCQVFGDPHIITFDQASYEFGGQCEYVLAMDCEEKSWYVYGQFDDCSTHGRASCLSSVTLYVNNDIQIQLLRGWVVNNDGKRITVDIGAQQTVTGADGTVVKLTNDEEWLTLEMSRETAGFNGFFQLRWDGFTSAQILLGAGELKTCGLCGNTNGDSDDDMRTRYYNELATSVAEFGDTWTVDRYKKCVATAVLPAWDWEQEFAGRKQEAVEACNKVYTTSQFVACGDGWEEYEQAINPAPYYEACLADYMRSDFLEGMGLNPACVSASNYAERCGNTGNKNHLWREQTGCSGTEEELEEYRAFILDLGCNF